jgi:hypothetical protein
MLLGSLLALSLAGCAAAPPAAAPSGAGAAAPEQSLDLAERELHAALGIAPGAALAAAPPPPAAPAAPAEAPAKAAPAPADAAAESRMATSSHPPDACETACTALGSMGRSADAICRLSTDADPRCADARARVKRAADEVRSRCPRCS